MKTHGKLIHSAGLILFLAGIFIGMITAGGLTWAGLEAHFYFGYGIQGDRALKVHCPLVLAAADTGAVAVSVSNPSEMQVEPKIKADISGPYYPNTSQVQLTIDPGQRQTARWEIGSGNITFGHLILAQVYQYASYPLSSAKGYCGTLVLNLHGLTGKQFFALFLTASLFGIIVGLLLAGLGRRHMDERKTDETGGLLFLSGLILVGILAGAMGWWMLGVIVLAISVLLTVILFGRRIIAL